MEQERRNDSLETVAIQATLQGYFDGLYFNNQDLLWQVFHPEAIYVCANTDGLLVKNMNDYFQMLKVRTPPSEVGQIRRDKILWIDFQEPTTATAKVQCSIAPKFFTDYLTLIKSGGDWKIISKVFSYTTSTD